MAEYENKITSNIPTNQNHQLIQEALKQGDLAIQQQRAGSMRAIDNAQGGLYDVLGRMQLQNEQSIKQRRTQALRQGMTSSGLAALEMQNMQTAQIGAQQIAQEYAQERMMTEGQFAGQEAKNRQFMMQQLSQNTLDKAAIEGQMYASSTAMQMQSLFPDAPPEVLELLSRRFNRMDEMTADEKKQLSEFFNPSSTATNKNDPRTAAYGEPVKPMSMDEFANSINYRTNPVMQHTNLNELYNQYLAQLETTNNTPK